MQHYGFWEGMIRELGSGQGQFRLYLQPAMALILGIRAGIADAKQGHLPFGRRVVEGNEPRRQLLAESIKRSFIPLALAFVLDVILQRLTLGYVRPLAAVVVAAVLVWIPFLIIRGVTNRFWRRPPHVRRTAHVN